tara:strand:+ start:980 stop:2149 length:1170 start_codon:yes stop_codon:yes gene_type:complete
MPQDSRNEDLDLANSVSTAPLLAEPQFGYLNIIGSPTDEFVDVDIYRIGILPRDIDLKFYVGGPMVEMKVQLASANENGDFTILRTYEAGTDDRMVEVSYTTISDQDLYVVITDEPGNDFRGDSFTPEAYVITHSSSLAFAQGNHVAARGEGFVRNGTSGDAGTFLLEIIGQPDFPDDADGGLNETIASATIGSDFIIGRNSIDTIDGLEGDDRIFGMIGNDTILGGRGADILYGNQGRDILHGDAQNDYLYGGQDADLVYGGLGTDVLYGNRGIDILYGGDKSDTLYGGQGGDVLYGGDGDDVLFGNRGSDALFGGEGSDIFVIAGHQETSVIFDFTPDEGDRIAVSGGLKTIVNPDGLLIQQVGTDSQVILVGIDTFDDSFVLDISF